MRALNLIPAILLAATITAGCADLAPPTETGRTRDQVPVLSNGADKVTLCHKVRNTITVGAPAVAPHLAHGDVEGPCDPACVKNKPSGVISWWQADGDVTDAVDANGGALVGGAGFGAGKCGLAFHFDAIGERVEVPHHVSLNIEILPSATVEGWFKSFGGLENVPGQVLIVGKHTCGVATGWFFTTGSGAFIGNHLVGGSGLGALNLHDGLFHHFAVVKDGTSYFEYVDGVLLSSDAGPPAGTPAPGDPPMQIGAFTTGTCAPVMHQLNGLVDEVAIYNRALSAAEIAAMNQP